MLVTLAIIPTLKETIRYGFDIFNSSPTFYFKYGITTIQSIIGWFNT